MIMKHISGRAHDVCVLARRETALITGCGLRIPHPRPSFSSLCSSGQCGVLKKDLEVEGVAEARANTLKRVGSPGLEGGRDPGR